MIHISFLFVYFTAGLRVSSSLRILDKRLDCNQPDLEHCKIDNCIDKGMLVPLRDAPTDPEWVPEQVGVGMDKHGFTPVLNLTWSIKADSGVQVLQGSQINIVDKSTNQSMCVQYSYNISGQINPKRGKPWTFSLDGVVVHPDRTYTVSVLNLPQPYLKDKRIQKHITIPGCDDKKLQKAQICLENGSLWELQMTSDLSLNWRYRTLSVVIGFNAAEYSEKYQVSVTSPGVFYSKNVLKENRRSLNVTFELSLSELLQCEIVIKIQPFFIQCKNDCWCAEKHIEYCSYYYKPRTLIVKAAIGLIITGGCLVYFIWRECLKGPVKTLLSAAKEEPEGVQVQNRRRVLIIYSLDHPLYKNIVLKLCAFLVNKCGTEVVLDLLDSTRLGVMGSIQWLDWHREQIENSSNKILILCSQGVQAKWKAMCGGKQVLLREDACSSMGDMLIPALCLMVPHFVRSASFERYIVAYFDDVCSEEDVPSPFNITVRYKLMKQFEELFFRILDTEKHEPGRLNHIDGLSEEDYYHCPSGKALWEAIEAFRAYQLEHPQWFEEELLESSELDMI
ncbi:interleukin-17 receptor A isoform X1 [Sphaeramia orbicularis]|uniref:interleukin-17 receptor A isoform X1 n=1 Tax=Sphaeramia orbicularis TaxID=375764 RepID=UPI00117FF565|nr:interleukin-17 receptor A-like isoform X1 [Sphaeramia orbicularis]